MGGGLCMIKLFFTFIFDENEEYVYKERLSKLLPEDKDDKSIEEDAKQTNNEEE